MRGHCLSIADGRIRQKGTLPAMIAEALVFPFHSDISPFSRVGA